MNNEINVQIKIELDATPGLQRLLRAIFEKDAPPKPEQVIEVREAQTSTPAEETKPESETTPAPESPAAAPAEPEPKPDYPTLSDVREAIDNARKRIEGADYKENRAGEMYKKYHANLTKEFLRIASLLGADKPSLLPEDKRAAFISECQQLRAVDNFGNVGKSNAF